MRIRSASLGRRNATAVALCLFTVAAVAAPAPPPPLPPTATLFNDHYSFTTSTPTHSAGITVGTDGSWLKVASSNGGGWMNCSDRYQVHLTPNFSPYPTLLGLGPTLVDACLGDRCFSCSPQWGGVSKSYTYHTTDTDPGIVFAGAGVLTLSALTSDPDSLFMRLDQYNRADMTGMTIFHSREEDNPEPLQPSDPERYFIATGADKVPVVAELLWGSVDKFPAGPNVTYTAKWDTGSVVHCDVNPSPLMPYGYSIVGVPVPKMSTGKHKFTVTAKLPSGKTHTSTNSIEVMVYAQNIYIGVEGSFQPKNPVDQLPQFIPGAALNGTNLDLRTAPQMVQLNILIGRGSSGTFSVKLTDISRYPGIAMNYPLNATDGNPDIDFGVGITELFEVPIPKGGAPKVVKLPLYIYDYAASATIEVTMPYRKTTFTARRRIPLDENGNGLPDAGWHVGMTAVVDTGLSMTTDLDDDSSSATTYKGDGFSAFEEFRGVFQTGVYARLDPRRRDLFLNMDPSLHIIPEAAFSRLFTLPVMVHFVDESEISGEDYAPRSLTKTKPVVNTNRTGVPGARTNGQRAVRVIHQQQFYPTVPRISYTTGDVVNVPAYRAGIFGMTILDAQNPSAPENNPPPGGYTAQTPNATRVVELYEETYVSTGIHTTFSGGPFGYYDKNGEPTEPCLGPGNPSNCDHFDLLRHMIRPFQLGEGFYAELHTIPSYSDDYYTIPGQRCDFPGVIFDGGFTPDHIKAQRGAVVAHEIGHAIHINHNFICGTMMSDRITDTAPPPTTFNSQERSVVRLWQ